jgi:hypothetical protein
MRSCGRPGAGGKRRVGFPLAAAIRARTISSTKTATPDPPNMKVQVSHPLKTDVDSAFRLCTEQKSQQQVYAQLGGSNVKIKRAGKSPKVQLQIARTMPANPPAVLRKIVPSTNEVSHTEDWSAQGKGYAADIVVEIKGVPVKIKGTKSLRPEKGGCSVEWDFDVTSGVLLLGGIIAAFAGEEMRKNLEDEYAVLKKSV